MPINSRSDELRKILIISGIFPPDIGGPATYVPQISTGLVALGHSATVVTLSDRLEHDDQIYPFRIVRLPRQIFKARRWLRTVMLIMQLGRDADVLFVNGLTMEAALANLWLRKPMVQKVVGDLSWERATHLGWIKDNFEDFQKQRYGIRIEALKWLRSWWTRQADQVIVPSQYLAQWVQGWGVPQEKLVVIYNALELPKSILPAQVPLKTRVKLVSVGRLVPWKHVDRLLAVLSRWDDVGLVVVGDGSERSHLEGITQELNLAERVYFAGQLSQEETLALMAACDIFVLNSSYEGLPHVVLEAISLGLPVVATAVGGTPEVVLDGENGLLIAPLDDQALYEALLKLLTSASERQRLTEGARYSCEQFSFGQMLAESAKLLADYK
ncbi:glycosyltransferase [Lyngbya aestuarii]|uniref:glycosyltransferase n=1 Tax=Lyngbya aestuarii TaxID=118322 RepID=UPI00403D90CC